MDFKADSYRLTIYLARGITALELTLSFDNLVGAEEARDSIDLAATNCVTSGEEWTDDHGASVMFRVKHLLAMRIDPVQRVAFLNAA